MKGIKMKNKLNRVLFIDTMGNCFLCARESSLLPEQTSPEESLTKLQILSRYLKMDLSKVFQAKGLIPQTLLAKVVNSQLKVSLCKTCVSLNERVSGLCLQLEKIQMDVLHCLELIKENLHGAIESENNRTNEVLRRTDNNSEEEKWALSKIEIADILRKEAIEKCDQKLKRRVPRATIQKLSSHQVYQSQIRMKSNTKKTTGSQSNPANLDDISPELKIEYLKQEQLNNDFMTSEDEMCDYGFENVEGDGTIPPDPLELPVPATSQSCSQGLTTEHKRKPQQRKRDKHPKTIIPKPIKLVGVVGNPEGQCLLNKTTGRYRCRHCPKEYTEESNFNSHFKRAHLDQKFKCTACPKVFSYKQRYDNHYLEMHAGLPFECKRCDKTFPQEWKLREHNRFVHLGRKNGPVHRSQTVVVIPPVRIFDKTGTPQCSMDSGTGLRKCKLCSMQFKTDTGFQIHYRASHLGQRFKCTLCSKLFTRMVSYKQHYINFHVTD